MIQKKMQYLHNGAAKYTGSPDRYVQFAKNNQLLNPATWANFVRVFRSDSDDCNLGWRGEFWGKMMRGACLIYRYAPDPELYGVLETTVVDMLDAQRDDGRFSTYSREAQLQGWDIWSRKYILTAMLHFHGICKDTALKERILSAMCHHIDALIADVGDGEGQRPITETSNYWGCMNSCTILDPVVELYTLTGKQEYLDFAKYIIGTGGCNNGDLLATALENTKMPHEYPQVKAYEMMSFFEGLLSYYELTGEEKYLTAVTNFAEAVYASDITVIGCAGCTHELFDHSAVRQVLESDNIMQETCVTVTWMRLLARLHLLTGEVRYMERMEQSAYNALYGSANEHNLPGYSLFKFEYLDPLPFDSYAPLYNKPRGQGVGGHQDFAFGGLYGCCACIASAGIAIFPLCAVLKEEAGFTVNSFLGGVIEETTPGGQAVKMTMESTYPAEAAWKCVLELERAETFTVKLRIPEFCENAQVLVNGAAATVPESGYLELSRQWNTGDVIEFKAQLELKAIQLGGRTAFTYGALVLARDEEKEGGADLEETVPLQPIGGKLIYRLEAPNKEYGELIRIYVNRTDGGELLLTDFASCGKKWLSKHNRMTVWMNAQMERRTE